MEDALKDRIQTMVDSYPVLLFMKGSPDAPQCGFSSRVASILKDYGKPFAAFDVLSDPSIRQGIKEFSNWPTITQLYIRGEFVGGSDIVSEMYAHGELQPMLDETATESS